MSHKIHPVVIALCSLMLVAIADLQRANATTLTGVQVGSTSATDQIIMNSVNTNGFTISTTNLDHNIFVDTFGEATHGVQVPFQVDPYNLAVRADGASCDLFATAQLRAPYIAPIDQMRLRLDAVV